MLKIGFVGDTCFTKIFSPETINKTNEIISGDINRWLTSNEFNVINIEGPLTSIESIKKGGTPLKSDPQESVLEILSKMNCNILCLANNHIMDSGYAGLQDTIDIAQSQGMLWLGAGKNLAEAATPLIIDNVGPKIALFGMTHQEGQIADKKTPGPFSDYHEAYFRERVAAVKTEVGRVILVYHGGEEYSFIPMPQRRKKLKRFLSYGVDVIVCHHPHVVQGYEMIGDKYIFYSLGNFIFDTESQRKMAGTTDSVLLRLSFEDNRMSYDRLFTRIDRERGVVVKVDAQKNFMPLNEKNYLDQWRQEAARLIFGRLSLTGPDKNSGTENTGQDEKNGIFHFSDTLRVIFSHKTYQRLIYVMQKNMRPIFFAALFYKMKNIFCHSKAKVLII